MMRLLAKNYLKDFYTEELNHYLDLFKSWDVKYDTDQPLASLFTIWEYKFVYNFFKL